MILKFFLRKEFKLLPNRVTLLRLLFVPFIYYFAFAKNQLWVLIFFAFAGATDAIDGFIARMLKQTTKFGAWFDSFADAFFYGSIPIWGWLLFPVVIKDNMAMLGVWLGLFVIDFAICFAKWKTLPWLHLWTAKAAAILTYFFVVFTLAFGYNKLFLQLTLVVYYMAIMEEIAVLLLAKRQDPALISIFSLGKPGRQLR